MSEPEPETLSTIVDHCVNVVLMLQELPDFEGHRKLHKVSKVLPLPDDNQAHICEIFSLNAAKLFGAKSLRSVFALGPFSQVVDRYGKPISQGLIMQIIDGGTRFYDHSKLTQFFHDILDKLIHGWNLASIEDNPDIFFKKDPDQFYLFRKTSKITNEDTLIRFLAARLGMEKDGRCYNYWYNGSAYGYNQIYLWVKKTSIKQFVYKFNFDLSIK